MSKNDKSSIIEAKQTISRILDTTKEANKDITYMSNEFSKIDQKYEDYENETTTAEKQIKELKLR